MATNKLYRTWQQANGIEIEEVDYDYDAYAFEVSVNGNHLVTIYADSPETEAIRASLDAGEDVRDWEDGNGNNVGKLIEQRSGDGLRRTLKGLEEEGGRYDESLTISKNSNLWVDKVIVWFDTVNDVYYEYETDDLDLNVDDLTDEDLKDVVIGGIRNRWYLNVQ